MSKYLFILVIFALVSCRVERRLYNPGYNISSSLHGSIQQDRPEPIIMASIDAMQSLEMRTLPVCIGDSCDNIIMRDGTEIRAIVSDIGLNEITYKKCDNQNGPTVRMRKSDVLMIKYSNGTKDIINSAAEAPKETPQVREAKKEYSGDRKVEGNGIASFAAGILAFIVGGVFSVDAGIILGVAAIVLGIISLVRIGSRPEKRKGRGLAITGIIAGGVAVAMCILYLFLYYYGY